MTHNDLDISTMGKFLKTARLTDERYIDIEEPNLLIKNIIKNKIKADIFTFGQRLPDSKPQCDNYHLEFDTIAAIPITTYDRWLEKQIPKQTRTSIKKAQKAGLIVQKVDFDDAFIQGMTDIFNESPIRQGKPFWHYGKDFETIKREFSIYSFREDHIGCYYNDELIGFIFLAYAGRFAITIQIISKIKYQDKKPNNALIAKAVETCAEKNIPWLVFGRWARGSWGEFKRHNGFENIVLPRYYIPLTLKGKIALKLGLHRGIAGILPKSIIPRLINLREKFYLMKHRNAITYKTNR